MELEFYSIPVQGRAQAACKRKGMGRYYLGRSLGVFKRHRLRGLVSHKSDEG